MSVSEMAITLHAVNQGFFDDVDVKKALEIEKQMHAFIKQNYGDLVDAIETRKDLDVEAEKALTDAIGAFKASIA